MNYYALIKDGTVFNILVFDNPTVELVEEFKNLNNADLAIEVEYGTVAINDIYDGVNFISPEPFVDNTVNTLQE